MTKKGRRKFAAILEALREELPTSRSVLVSLIKTSTIRKTWGSLDRTPFGDFDEVSNHIRVCCDVSNSNAIDTLLHEYAHARQHDGRNVRVEHCTVWGIEYARAYRVKDRVDEPFDIEWKKALVSKRKREAAA